jgi:two-component system, OmpR family, response regulator
MRILLVEDDLSVSDYVARGLSENGHVCDVLACFRPREKVTM